MTGSVTPPRHWRRKAKAARVRGRMVKRRRRREVEEVVGGCLFAPAIVWEVQLEEGGEFGEE